MKFGFGSSAEKNGIPHIERVAPDAAIPIRERVHCLKMGVPDGHPDRKRHAHSGVPKLNQLFIRHPGHNLLEASRDMPRRGGIVDRFFLAPEAADEND